jgi:hypothetical protein
LARSGRSLSSPLAGTSSIATCTDGILLANPDSLGLTTVPRVTRDASKARNLTFFPLIKLLVRPRWLGDADPRRAHCVSVSLVVLLRASVCVFERANLVALAACAARAIA